MSLFIVGIIAGVSLVAGLLIVMSEQVRAGLRLPRLVADETRASDAESRFESHDRTQASSVARPRSIANEHEAIPLAAKSRAAAYREILDALGDDLDQDIAEWEAVLEEFPQVIGAEELHVLDNPATGSVTDKSHRVPPAPKFSEREPTTFADRSRHVSPEERSMIRRLLNTGFAPEEIALWLNLPLERVREQEPR